MEGKEYVWNFEHAYAKPPKERSGGVTRRRQVNGSGRALQIQASSPDIQTWMPDGCWRPSK
jgi:hypothetical protein